MKWLIEKPNKPKVNKTKWHIWFAWYPVKVGKHMIFFEKVYRKGTQEDQGGGFDSHWVWIWEYDYITRYDD